MGRTAGKIKKCSSWQLYSSLPYAIQKKEAAKLVFILKKNQEGIRKGLKK